MKGVSTLVAASLLVTVASFRVQRQTKCNCVDYKLCAEDKSQEGMLWYDAQGVLWFNLRSPTCRSSLEVCCRNILRPQRPQMPKIRESKQAVCGKRNPGGIDFRIVEDGNNEAQFAEFPWMIAMLEKVTQGGEEAKIYDCGGALIHKNVVLTAAHCVSKKTPDKLVMRAGDWDTQTKLEPLPHQDRFVSQVIIHESFDQDNLYNDVALLITSEPFEFADNVQLVCLPRPEDVISSDACWATGWGQNSFYEEGKYQVILKKVNLPIVETTKCQRDLRKTELGPTFDLHPSFICAGGFEEKDTCKGDGGSPLVCPIKGNPMRYQQVGIVAWGVKCGGPTPAAYVNVAKFRRWIDQKMAQLGLKVDYNY